MIAAEMVLMANSTVLVFQIISDEKLKREETFHFPLTFQLAPSSSCIIAIMFENMARKGKGKFLFLLPSSISFLT